MSTSHSSQRSSNLLIGHPLIRTIVLIFILHVAICIDKELPSFVDLPPPTQYYQAGDPAVELQCRVWPPSARVQMVVSSRRPWSTAGALSQGLLTLAEVDRGVGEVLSPGRLRVAGPHLAQLQDQSLHCLAATDFATVLSRPFRLRQAGMSEFGAELASKPRVVDKTFLRGNVAVIDCWPPESHPRAVVRFDHNKVEVIEGGKYRVVHWSDGKRISLLISPADQTDRGLYRCMATNPITRMTKTSSDQTNLIIEVPTGSVAPSITVPISGRENGPQQITARQGSNVTLFCVMRGEPRPQIQIYNYNNDPTASPRYLMDKEFGLLHIRNLKGSDAGSYMCSDKYITSSALLKVVEPLNITTRPLSVVLESLPASATFHCVSSKLSVTVQWFFNGRPIAATSNSTLLIQTVTMTNLGIYQCVAQDHDEWVSASATLSIRSYNLVSRPSLGPQEAVQAPSVQNVDQQQQILSIPTAERIHDNMAVFVRWQLQGTKYGPVAHYVLQYTHRARADTAWSPTVTVQEKINQTYYYVTGRHLQPQTFYRFRVHAFYTNTHTVTSNWSTKVNFLNVGAVQPTIEESSVKAPGTIVLRWSYHGVDSWPVDTFRVLCRRAVTNGSQPTERFDRYTMKEVAFPTLNTSLEGLEPGSDYQVVVYGVSGTSEGRTITRFSQPRLIPVPVFVKTTPNTTPSTTSRFFSGLLESWKSNKLLYGSLFALTGFLILVMILLLLLCLCRQRRFRNNKNSSSSHTFAYAYKEVSKSSSAANNNSSTLQIPGRMPQYSSQLALQQFQPNNGSIDRRTADTSSQIHRDGSYHAMDTTSLITDIYNPNNVHMGQMQHPYQGFSTLPQGYPSSHQNRNNPQYQHFLQQQHATLGSSRRENPTGDSNRDSMIEQSMEMPSRHMSASQQHLMMMQQGQEHPRAPGGYYSGRQGALSPQMMMMMGSQQSLGPYGQFRRSTSQNYQGHMETPIAISASGHPLYQMDPMAMDPSGRPISPQYQYMQQQQAAQMAGLHPSMMDMYNQPQLYVRPGGSDYGPQGGVYRQQYRRSDSDCGGPGGVEPGYSYLPNSHHPTDLGPSRQHTLNSLPEQPMDPCNNNNPQQDSPGNMAANNSSSSGRHHHRRKTRSRQQNVQDNPSFERTQGNHGDMPPMLAPRSKVPYTDSQNLHRQSGHDHNAPEGQDASIHDCNSESNATGDNFDPPLQYSIHYDGRDPNDNEAAPNNPLLIENLPRIRDVSEYGIPVGNNNHGHQQRMQHHAPVPPLKSTSRHHNPPQAPPANGYNMECNPDYYSSATSSDRSGPSPPPKYAPPSGVNVPMGRPDDVYIKSLYYHGDTHC